MTPRVRKVLDWILGVTLLAIGVVGLVLPILQGWFFILAGLAVLSRHNRYAKLAMDRVKARMRWMRAKWKASRERS